MFDIGMSEMLVIAAVAIIVVGPKDLPKMLRTIGKTVSGMKRMAGDFQKQLTDVVDDSDFASVKDMATGKSLNPVEQFKDIAKDVQKDLYINDDDVNLDADASPFPENDTSKKLSGMYDKAEAKKSVKKATAKTAKKAPVKKPGSKSTSKSSSKAAAKSTTKSAVKKAPAKPAKKAATKKAATKTVTAKAKVTTKSASKAKSKSS